MDGMRYRFLNNSFVIIFVFKVLTAKTPLFLFEDFFLTIEVKWFGLPLRRDAKFCVSTPWVVHFGSPWMVMFASLYLSKKIIE